MKTKSCSSAKDLVLICTRNRDEGKERRGKVRKTEKEERRDDMREFMRVEERERTVRKR